MSQIGSRIGAPQGAQAGRASRGVRRARCGEQEAAAALAAGRALLSGAARARPRRTARCARRFSATATGSSTRKAFRRLTHKTQVFVAPRGDHYRTRLTHTLEVTTISRTVARALRLNEDLVEAIGLGHDLGHPPFGHIGEEVLDDCLRERFGRDFRHYEHSLRRRSIALGARRRAGLNLTEQVRDGIARHSSRAPLPATLEGRIVRRDRPRGVHQPRHRRRGAGGAAARGGAAGGADRGARRDSGSARIDTLVHDMVEHSERAGDDRPGAGGGPGDGRAARLHVRARLPGPGGARRARARSRRCVRRLFEHYVEHPELLPARAGRSPPGAAAASEQEAEAALAQRVTDYLAGMTDRYCIRRYTELEVPQAFAR